MNRRTVMALLGALTLSALLTPLLPAAPAAHAAEPVTLDKGHVDAISPRLDGSGLHLDVADGTGAATVHRDPAEVTFGVLPRAAYDLPADLPAAYAFLGEAGDRVWMLPLTQDPELLWPGWSTERIPAGALAGDRMTFTLSGVDGPGAVALWTTDSFGNPAVTANSRDGLPDSFAVGAHVHAHSYWAFTRPGDYALHWTVTATKADGTPLTATAEHRWRVGESAPTGRKVLDVGHTDAVSVHLDGGALKLRVKDETQGARTFREPGDVILQVRDHARWTLPELPEGYGFLGEAGDEVWLLSDTMDRALLWPGWSTETLGRGVFRDNSLRLSLVDADGPGAVKAFVYGDFGEPVVQFDSSDGGPDAVDVIVPTHAHTNWIFTEPGAYTLRFQASGALADGTAVSSPVTEYTWVVGEGLPADAAVRPGASVHGGGTYVTGTTVTLTARPDPALAGTYTAWLRRCPTDLAFTLIDDQTALSYSFPATADLDGCRFVAQFRDPTGRDAVSTAATVHIGSPGPAPGASQIVTAALDGTSGGLVISVNPADRTVNLPLMRLSGDASRWETAGDLRPVTVTDTRAANPGWNLSGQVADLTSGRAVIAASCLGWTPRVAAHADGQTVTAGPVVTPGLDGGPGLSRGATLAAAPAGAGLGTARLDAVLALWAATGTGGGTYTTTLTLTAI